MYQVTFRDEGRMLKRLASTMCDKQDLSLESVTTAPTESFGQVTTLIFRREEDGHRVKELLSEWQVLDSGHLYFD